MCIQGIRIVIDENKVCHWRKFPFVTETDNMNSVGYDRLCYIMYQEQPLTKLHEGRD